MMKSLCVFCGSSPGRDPAYAQAARDLGARLASRQIRLVYGGGNVGLMGAVADGCLEAGGEVIGVIPEKLRDYELAHPGATQMHVVETMHQRKALMAELSDAFLALPGAIGTLEETIEAMTWTQLGYHVKPCGLLNVAGYFDRLLDFLGHMTEEGFLRPAHMGMLIVETDADRMLDRLASEKPVHSMKWVERVRG